jgi:histidinol phosphatase-like PHP family hydrolase
MTHPGTVPLVSYHTHTDLSLCGRTDMTFEAAVEYAVTEGYAAVGFTDHVHTPEVTDYGEHLARLRSYKERRRAIEPRIEVLIGGEFDVVEPGKVSGSEEIVAACEYFVVATNHYHVHWVTAPAGDAAAVAAHELETLETAIGWPHTGVIAHPFNGNVKRPDCGPGDQYRACDKTRLRELLVRAIDRGIGLEIQPKSWHQLNTDGALAELYDDWLDRGGLLAPGSDAHTLESLRHWGQCYGEVVRRFSLTPDRIWHPRPLTSSAATAAS